MNSRASLVAAAAVMVCLSPLARGEEPSREELLEQIRELQSRVGQLESHQLDRSQTRDQARVVDAMFRDAQRRSDFPIQDVTITGGYDPDAEKFFLSSDDGNFLLMPGFLFQARHVTNFNSDGDDDVEAGFEIRRMRVIADGTLFSRDVSYRFQFESNSNGGGVFLQDAFVRYAFRTPWAVQLGQFYDVAHHEQTLLDQFQLAADRSFINGLIGGGQSERIQGVMLVYDDKEKWRGQVLLHDGYNSDNTPFNDGGGTAFTGVSPTNWGASVRLEHFFSGTRRAYEDFTALGTTEDLFVVGGGASYSQGGDSDVIFHTIDAQYENTNRFGAYAALLGLWRDIGPGSPVAAGSYHDWGLLVQGSYLVSRKIEPFAQYNLVFLDDEALAPGAEDTVQQLLIGANYYFHRHNAKLTVDLGYLPDGSPANLPALGILAGDEDQIVIRAQFQLFI